MSTKMTSSSLHFDSKRLLFLFIPVLSYICPGFFLMGWTDTVYVLRLILTILIFALAAYPLSAKLFPTSRSGGFTLAKPLGILSTSLLVWTLTYLKIGRLNPVFIILSVLALAFCCWFPKDLRQNALNTLQSGSTIENIALEETLFALSLTLLCFFKGFHPDINGEEKIMDYGFLMSMVRNSKLPANDMWMSGYSINYYYYGQYIYAFLTKLSFITPSVMYNLSMCCSIALPFTMCYCIGQMLIDGAREYGVKCSRYISVIAGILTSFAVFIFGNSHSFYYDENSIGNGLLDLFYEWGINVGETGNFYYPQSTRYIGYNPDSKFIEGIKNGADYTIEEFPFYSYLIGDLHAHVCSTMVVLLIFALAVALISRIHSYEMSHNEVSTGKSIRQIITAEARYILLPEIVAASVLLGICQMTNYWDFLIYFIFGSMLLLVVNTYRTPSFSSVPGAALFIIEIGGILGIYLVCASIPLLHAVLQIAVFAVALIISSSFPTALTRTGTGMSFLFAVGTLVSLPFNMNFDMISNKIAPCVNHSSLYQLFILWGTHVIICVTFVVFVIIYKNVPSTPRKAKKAQSSDDAFNNPVQKFFKERNPIDVLMSGSVVVSILLLIAPEFFYVRDIYTGGYLRSNTMFKFTYAAFIILSICMIYSVFRLMFMQNRTGAFSTITFILSIVFCFFLFIPAHYPLVSMKQRNGGFEIERYKTLDGAAYLSIYTSPNSNNVRPGNLSDYDACIRWFNEEVSGTPVILEAYGLSYTDYNMVSAYTGLPTVCGWQTHEWLWRFHGIVDPETDLLVSDPEQDVWALYLTPRHTDIDIMYTSSDPEQVYELLKKYNVEYVIVGDLERGKYSGVDNTAMFASFGRVAFVSGDLMVLEIW